MELNIRGEGKESTCHTDSSEKGGVGYRINIVSDRIKRSTKGVNNLSSLRQLKIGLGHDWGDVGVYRSNGWVVKEVLNSRCYLLK